MCAPVGIAAKDRAAVGIVDHLALLRRHMRAAIRDGPVELSIRPEFRAVHIVPAVGDVDAEAAEQLLPRGRLALGRAREMPDVRDAGKPDVVAARDHARRHARLERGKSVGKTLAVSALPMPLLSSTSLMRSLSICPIVPVEVPVPIQVRVVLRWLQLQFRRERLMQKSDAIIHRAHGEGIEQPIHVLANIRHRSAPPIRLDHKRAPLLIETQRHHIREQRLLRPQDPRAAPARR